MFVIRTVHASLPATPPTPYRLPCLLRLTDLERADSPRVQYKRFPLRTCFKLSYQGTALPLWAKSELPTSKQYLTTFLSYFTTQLEVRISRTMCWRHLDITQRSYRMEKYVKISFIICNFYQVQLEYKIKLNVTCDTCTWHEWYEMYVRYFNRKTWKEEGIWQT